MEQDLVTRISADPRYIELQTSRNRLGWSLTILMLVVYYGFILLVAFNKPFLLQRLGDGVTTVGIPLGLGVIVFTIVITVFYVRRANREFDALAAQITQGALK